MSYPIYGFTFGQLQHEHAEWAFKNFGRDGDPRYHQRGSVLGITEEFGEFAEVADAPEHTRELAKALGRLAHATLKEHQGIRQNEDHETKAKDALADMIVFLADYATRRGWDFEDVVLSTWAEVRDRDWTANPSTGRREAPACSE